MPRLSSDIHTIFQPAVSINFKLFRHLGLFRGKRCIHVFIVEFRDPLDILINNVHLSLNEICLWRNLRDCNV